MPKHSSVGITTSRMRNNYVSHPSQGTQNINSNGQDLAFLEIFRIFVYIGLINT